MRDARIGTDCGSTGTNASDLPSVAVGGVGGRPVPLARMRFVCSVLVCVGMCASWTDVGWAGEQQKEDWTRGDLVSALERGPGPTKGSADAAVTMVYFTDFQCGYCRKFVKETLPKIEEQYIRTGKVRLVFRHLAILGEASIQAARASSCAFDQGKFWEYHDTLFASTSPMAFNAARLKQYAKDLRLDEQSFGTCFDKQVYGKRVEAETLMGRALGATGTPAFLMNGQLVLGAYPFEAFQQGLDGILATPPRAAPTPPRK
jgi:protein-disulfide isomerase